MDLIATYHPFTITTSFLGLITAVWAGFRCKRAFSMTKSVPNLTKSVPNLTKSVSNLTKSIPNLTKSASNLTKSIHNLTMESVIMACNYGDRLTAPILI